jgi:Mobilization protein NikA
LFAVHRESFNPPSATRMISLRYLLRASPRDPREGKPNMPRPKIQRQKLRQRRFEIRLTDQEWHDFSEQADRAGLTLSEFARRRIVGYRIMSRVEDKLLNELRRLGGLQKHLASQFPDRSLEFNEILKQIVATIRHADSRLFDDSVYNFEVEV